MSTSIYAPKGTVHTKLEELQRQGWRLPYRKAGHEASYLGKV